MITFLYPSYLWALWGLLVPIVIHLWSKKEAKTIKVGSVQLLSESKSKRSSSLQLNEWLLLLLRMAVLALLVLLMAKPQWTGEPSASKLVYIVEPSLLGNDLLKQRLDSLWQESEVRLLKKNFPLYSGSENGTGVEQIPDYWQLASDMDVLNADSIVVFTKGLKQGIKGMRPHTRNSIHWIQIDGKTSKLEKPIWAYKDNERLSLFTIATNAERTSFKKTDINHGGSTYQLNEAGDSLKIDFENTKATVPVSVVRPIEISLFYSDSLRTEKEYIETSFLAISSYLNREINVNITTDSLVGQKTDADLTIWLSEKKAPKAYQKLLVLKPNIFAKGLIEEGEGNRYFLTDRLNLDNVISQHFTEKLLLLLDLDKDLKNKAQEWDLRTVSERVLLPNREEGKPDEKMKAGIAISPWFWMILPLLLLIERILAYKRKQ